MNDLKNVLQEITDLTFTIKTTHPELYRFLDENPMTLTVKPRPQVDKKALQEYLQGLKQLMQHHQETHKTKSNPD